MAAKTINDETTNPSPRRVPVLPMLCYLATVYSWLLELLVLLGQKFSGGKWPAPLKSWVVFGVFVLATTYHFTLRKKHRSYDPIIGKAALTGGQAALIIFFLLAIGLFGAWLAMGPPGPEFKPA